MEYITSLLYFDARLSIGLCFAMFLSHASLRAPPASTLLHPACSHSPIQCIHAPHTLQCSHVLVHSELISVFLLAVWSLPWRKAIDVTTRCPCACWYIHCTYIVTIRSSKRIHAVWFWCWPLFDVCLFLYVSYSLLLHLVFVRYSMLWPAHCVFVYL
jgi:hypothetical protein